MAEPYLISNLQISFLVSERNRILDRRLGHVVRRLQKIRLYDPRFYRQTETAGRIRMIRFRNASTVFLHSE